MARYAADTKVTVNASKAEIERIVERYGAAGFMSAWGPGSAVLAWKRKPRTPPMAEQVVSRKDVALENEILRGLVGSTAHGTGLDGHEDRDEMGVCVEPAEYVCGLSLFEQFTHRTQPEGVRSGPGDLDLTIYSLRKFCRLAAKGNPSVLLLLWLPEYLTMTGIGERLVGLRDAFVSREAGWRYLGYLEAQRRALTGERSARTGRHEIIDRFGYDSKYAMHALRLGYQGIEYLSERRVSVPVPEPLREHLRSVRRGEVELAAIIAEIDKVSADLRAVTERTLGIADYAAINRFLIEAHHEHWAANKDT